MTKNSKERDDKSLPKKVAMGAAGVAAVSGVIAGAALLSDKKNQQKIGKGVKGLTEAVAHEVSLGSKKDRGGSGSGKKRKKRSVSK